MSGRRRAIAVLATGLLVGASLGCAQPAPAGDVAARKRKKGEAVAAAQGGASQPAPAAPAPAAPAEQPKNTGRPPFLGVSVTKDQKGLHVDRVLPGSPADKARIRIGDFVLEIDGQKLEDLEAFATAIRAHSAGDFVSVKLSRDGAEREVTVTLAERPGDPAQAPAAPPEAGPADEPGNTGRRPYLGVAFTEDQKGVHIDRVFPGTPADKANIKVGDFVLEIDGRKVGDHAALTTAIRAHSPGDSMRFKLSRDGAEMEVTVTLGGRPAAADRAPAAPPEAAASPAPADAAAPAGARAPATPASRELAGCFVLVVGVDRSSDAKIPALRFAEADARSVADFFSTDRRSPTSVDRVRLLLGKDATRVNVLAAIREHLARNATGPDDLAILFFAGQGLASGQDAFLACADTELDHLDETAVSESELARAWGKVRAGRKVFIADSCHAGDLGGGVHGTAGMKLAPDSGESASRSITIRASSAGEVTTDNGTLEHGVFTFGLLEGLRGKADADGDHRVSGAELAAYLVAEVPKLADAASGKQTPVVETTGDAGFFLTR